MQPVQLPIGEEDNFRGICDLISQKASFFEGKDGISRRFDEIPEEMKAKATSEVTTVIHV